MNVVNKKVKCYNFRYNKLRKILKMILIKEKESTNIVWKKALYELYNNGFIPQDERFARMESLAIEIECPIIEKIDERFPISQKNIDIINKYIISGEDEELVCHEWTKIYYHRLFDEPNSQIEYIKNRLKNNRTGIGTTWRKETDQQGEIKPCMLSIIVMKQENKLYFQLHARACNVYDKLLMNIQEFVSLQKYLAEELNLEIGRFVFTIDFAQIATKDIEKVKEIISQK